MEVSVVKALVDDYNRGSHAQNNVELMLAIMHNGIGDISFMRDCHHDVSIRVQGLSLAIGCSEKAKTYTE